MDDVLRTGADQVAKVLRDAGHEAFLAGGCVRDLLLGRVPHDYDIVTNARPEAIARLFRRTVLVGASFGVVLVHLSKGQEYEVATYRTEGSYTDGRHPDRVAYAEDKADDVIRRDFTINALLMDPFSGEVFDYVGGQVDLEQRLIRAVGEPKQRFAEDHLRMLRAVRFAARLDFAIEAQTLAAIQVNAERIRTVSAERILTELNGLFELQDPRPGLALLKATGLYEILFPFAPANPLHALGPMWQSSTEYRALSNADRRELVWAALLRGVSVADVESVQRRFRLSNAEIKRINGLLEWATKIVRIQNERPAFRMRMAIDKRYAVHRIWLWQLFGHTPEIITLEAAHADVLAHPLPSLPLVTGEDLKTLGYPPGRLFKDILDAVDNEVLERRVHNQAEALAYVKTRWPTAPSS